MKQIFTIASLITTFLLSAQDAGHVLSLNATFSEPGQFGISYEGEGTRSFFGEKIESASSLANLSFGAMNIDAEGWSVDGTGYVVELGGRQYYGEQRKNFKGPYTSNYLSYGSIKFDDTVGAGNFKGTYSYFSFFTPELGYKIKLGKFVIDPFIGVMWKIEIKGKGDVDNRYTDEWVFRGGLKLGYSF